MKPYFAKYLLVDKEIREGDTVAAPGIVLGKVTKITKTELEVENESSITIYSPIQINLNIYKAQLFLCSRDIQIGDEVTVHWNDGKITQEAVQKHNYWLSTELIYKVIGEISAEAKWVKEGDEFYEEDIQYQTHLYVEEFDDDRETYFDDKYKDFTHTIGLKGPCGHFH